MATVQVFTASRMAAIEAQAIVDARLEGTDLVLVRHNEEEINVGDVQGPAGPTHTFPGCVLETSVDQGSTDGAWWNISWQTELRDTNAFHAGTSDILTAPFDGWYHLCGSIVWEPTTPVGPRLVRYTVNGSGDNRMAAVSAENMGTRGARLPFANDIYLDAGDLLRVSALQECGTTLAIASGCRVSLRYLSAA